MARVALPDEAQLAQLNDWEDVRTFSGLSQDVWASIARELGDEGLADVGIIAGLLDADLAEAARASELKGAAKARLNLAVNMARLKANLPTSDLFGPGGVPVRGPPGDSGGVAPHGRGSGPEVREPPPVVHVLKVKDYYDQASRLTVQPLAPARIGKMRRRLQATTVLSVPDGVRYTDDQMSVLGRLIDAGYPMLAFDMGVWGPHDGRRQRAAALSAHVQNASGEWITKEFKGPADLEAWTEAWKFAAAGFLMGDVVDRAVAEGYEGFFTSMVKNYPGPDAWAVCAQAEWTFRFEFAADEVQRQQEFHDTNPDASLYEPGRPWNSVLLAGVRGIDALQFWEQRLKEPARRLLYSSAGASGSAFWVEAQAAAYHPVTGADLGAVGRSLDDRKGGGGGGGGGGGTGRRARKRAAETPRASGDGVQPSRPKLPTPLVRGRGKGGAEPDPNLKRPDGRYYMDSNGLELCYAWNRSPSGCSDSLGCRAAQKRVHACEWCREPHRAAKCPEHPGWTPPSPPTPGGGGGRR